MPCLSHLDARYKQYIKRRLIYRHKVNYCINCVLVFDLIFMILLILEVVLPLILLEFPKKYFIRARPSESAMLYENKPRAVCISSILTNKGNGPILVL